MEIVRIEVPKALVGVARLAQLLDALDRSPRVDAGQYRLVVQHLQQALRQDQDHPDLGRLLAHFPAASQVDENLKYGLAGLCHTPLDAAVHSETAARSCLERLRRPAG